MVYKALNGLVPEYISEIFVKISDTHIRILRSVDNELLRIPGSRTKIYENSFTISAAKLWNEIPLYIRNIKDLETFIKQINHSYITANNDPKFNKPSFEHFRRCNLFCRKQKLPKEQLIQLPCLFTSSYFHHQYPHPAPPTPGIARFCSRHIVP